MVWWIVGAAIAVSVVGLAVVAGMLRRRLTELERVTALAMEQSAKAQRLQASTTELQRTIAGLNERSAKLQRQLTLVKQRRTSRQ